MNKEMMEKILQKIKEYDRIMLFRHVRPDGDCVGATKGMKELLQASFPEKKIHLVIDADVLNWERACLHPGVNTKSIAISMADFKSVILPKLGHEPTVIEITGQTEA